jgi:hypothetical protein
VAVVSRSMVVVVSQATTPVVTGGAHREESWTNSSRRVLAACWPAGA